MVDTLGWFMLLVVCASFYVAVMTDLFRGYRVNREGRIVPKQRHRGWVRVVPRRRHRGWDREC